MPTVVRMSFHSAAVALLGCAVTSAAIAEDLPDVPAELIKFHGHECPGVTMGYRMAKEALKAMPDDVKLIAIAEHRFCGVDALQWVTGCTAGKASLQFKDYGKLAFTLYSAETKRGVRVLLDVNRIPAAVREDRAEFIEWLLTTEADAFLTIKTVSVNEPAVAGIRDSAPCAACGEPTVITHLRKSGGKELCIPCSEK